MPEYAELHLTAHLVQDAARGHGFTNADVNTAWSLPCSLPAADADGTLCAADARVMLAGTEAWKHGFELCARHRGKEVCLALRPLPEGATPPPDHREHSNRWCPTCAAVADDGEGRRPPSCSGHSEPCVLQTVRRSAKNLGKRFWSCGRNRGRCSFFRWASPGFRAKEMDWFPKQEAAVGCSVLLLTLRRGMHGRCVLLRAGEAEPRGVHLRFVRSDGSVLAFVDARVRVTKDAIWHFGMWGGPHRRSPDPLYEFDAFAARALALLDAEAHAEAIDREGEGAGVAPPVRDAAALLAAPVCELLLDQRICNGVGVRKEPRTRGRALRRSVGWPVGQSVGRSVGR